MRILILKTGEIIVCSYSRALRKIEQGTAVPVIDAQAKTTGAEPDSGDG